MKLPSVTFNIATYNDIKRLKNCIQYIEAQKYPNHLIKINIIDGGSRDETKEFALSKKI